MTGLNSPRTVAGLLRLPIPAAAFESGARTEKNLNTLKSASTELRIAPLAGSFGGNAVELNAANGGNVVMQFRCSVPAKAGIHF